MNEGVGGRLIGYFFQAEDGIRDFCLSRGLGDVYKRQVLVRGAIAYVIERSKLHTDSAEVPVLHTPVEVAEVK